MRKPTPNLRGFTLFEMILAATIFVILAGGIYFSISTSVSAANELGLEQVESRKNGSFARFIRSGFLNLPVEAEISVGTRNAGPQGNTVDLIIRRAPGAFTTGALDALGGGLALSALPDRKGKSTLSITRFPERLDEGELGKYLETALWLPLLENVETLRWRFWDENLSDWTELWERKDSHPQLIELTLIRAGEPEQVSVFRIPQLSPTRMAVRAPMPQEPPQ